jgi:DNA-binding MarR family transcriptional regulator
MTQDPRGFELFNEIGIIDQLAGTLFERGMPRGMTRAQFTVLNHFVRLGHDERSPAELANAFQITRPTMTSTLARMERAGLVSIRADPLDGRAKRVSVTDKGRAMRETCIGAVENLLPLVHQIVADAELEAILPVLRRLRVGLDEARNR